MGVDSSPRVKGVQTASGRRASGSRESGVQAGTAGRLRTRGHERWEAAGTPRAPVDGTARARRGLAFRRRASSPGAARSLPGAPFLRRSFLEVNRVLPAPRGRCQGRRGHSGHSQVGPATRGGGGEGAGPGPGAGRGRGRGGGRAWAGGGTGAGAGRGGAC